jgi:hypothetical protein
MPRITIAGGITTLPLEVSLGSFVDQAGNDPTSVGNNWGGLDCSGASSTTVFYGGIGGNLTGSIAVPRLVRFDADGDIAASITSTNAGTNTCIVEGASVSSSGSIVLTNGTLARVRMYSGDVAGAVQAVNGSITEVTVDSGRLLSNITASNGRIDRIVIGGTIGASGSNRTIAAMDGIGTIDAHAIYANITANSGGDGDIGRITTDDGSPSTHAGVFAGSLNARLLLNTAGTTGMSIDGD